MTNYEKYKDLIIGMLIKNIGCCEQIWGLKHNKPFSECPREAYDDEVCSDCEVLLEEWLEKEATTFDLEELEAGDKIRMRKLGEKDAWMYEVVCNSFPAMWLRLRAVENGVQQAKDENFLIFYDDLIDGYEFHEVIKND